MIDDTVHRLIHESPLGPLALEGGRWGLRSVRLDAAAACASADAGGLDEVARQLDEYFAGRRRAFEVPLDLRGGPLETRVWSELRRIPHGTTVSYGELAEAVGRPDAVRAVAGAVARTPAPIVVPCHRVIGADGALRGYIGGLERKAALLELERTGSPPPAPAPQLELL